MYCINCGKKVGDSETTCPKCGATEFSEQRRSAKFKGLSIIWMLISFGVSAVLGVVYLILGLNGTNPNVRLMFAPPFLSFELDYTGGFNIALFIIGLLLVIYSLVYILLIIRKQQYLYGVLMVAAICIASFMFFFYGGSPLSIIMIPVMLIFPTLTRIFIGDEWDYMG